MAASQSFQPSLFKYLRDLAANNDREWFHANKQRYELELKDPALAFISDCVDPLCKISPHFRADPRPVGGSLFRIYRDTRFSKDKTPYKTHVGLHFRHDRGKDVHTPGFYLHLDPSGSFIGAGIWRPDTDSQRRIREAIVADPARWKRAISSKKFRESFALEGDSLKRPPRGFDADHPLVEDLKRKDFICTRKISQKEITGSGFRQQLMKDFRTAGPLMHFLCDALELQF